MSRLRFIFVLLLWSLALASCAELQQRTHERAGGAHNADGGYVEACGDLPGLIGDDC
jgi:hypothetical protein